VYDIRALRHDGYIGCREKGNSFWNCKPLATGVRSWIRAPFCA